MISAVKRKDVEGLRKRLILGRKLSVKKTNSTINWDNFKSHGMQFEETLA